MKKIYILILLITVLLSGCNDDELYYLEPTTTIADKEEKQFSFTPSSDTQNTTYQNASVLMAQIFPSGKYIYFTVANMLYRFNTETGNITSACADPLCMHNSVECPFFHNNHAVTYVSIFDDRIYFKTRESDFANKVLISVDQDGEHYHVPTILTCKVYDIANQEVKISKRDYSESGLLYHNEYCTEHEEYYFDMIHDEETDQWSKALKCYDSRTNKTRVIGNYQENTNTVFVKYEDGKLLYCDEISFGWLNTQSGQKEAIFEGDCVALSCDDANYYYIKSEDKSLWRMPIAGGDPEYLGVNDVRGDYNITDNYIYFRYLKAHQVATMSDGQPYEYVGQEFWRMDKDGSNLIKVFEFTGEYEAYNINNMVINGNYIYGIWKRVDEEGNIVSSLTATDTLWGSILRIDMTTGELYFIDVPK